MGIGVIQSMYCNFHGQDFDIYIGRRGWTVHWKQGREVAFLSTYALTLYA
jgi:hypothetical protein